MSNLTSLILAAVCVLGIVLYRDRQRSRRYADPSGHLSQRDEQFAIEACYEGMRCVGYSCAPGCDNPAQAAEAGEVFCRQTGITAVMAASLVASGMVAHYVATHRRPGPVASAMLNTMNTTLASAFGTSAEMVHDARARTLQTTAAAKTVFEIVSEAGFRSSVLAQGDELGAPLRTLVG